jgi:hypothetical protein
MAKALCQERLRKRCGQSAQITKNPAPKMVAHENNADVCLRFRAGAVLE